MIKFELLEILDNLTSEDNQIRLDLSLFDSEMTTKESILEEQNYKALLKQLLFLALPSSSQNLH